MQEIFINGTNAKIEGQYYQSTQNDLAILMLDSYSLEETSISSNITKLIYNNLTLNNITTLKIDLHQRKSSENSSNKNIYELTDATIAMDFLLNKNPFVKNYCIIGFSFGAWITMQIIMRRPEINNFITISTPINKYDFSFIHPSPIPGLMIHGDLDSIAPVENLISSINKFNRPKKNIVEYQIIGQADHYFRGKTEELNQIIQNYINKNTIKKNPNVKKTFL